MIFLKRLIPSFFLLGIVLASGCKSNKVSLSSPEFAKACQDSFPCSHIKEIVIRDSVVIDSSLLEASTKKIERLRELVNNLSSTISTLQYEHKQEVNSITSELYDTIEELQDSIKKKPTSIRVETVKNRYFEDSSKLRVFKDSILVLNKNNTDCQQFSQKVVIENKALTEEISRLKSIKPTRTWFYISIVLFLVAALLAFLLGRKSKN